jgi:hypothetical protein
MAGSSCENMTRVAKSSGIRVEPTIDESFGSSEQDTHTNGHSEFIDNGDDYVQSPEDWLCFTSVSRMHRTTMILNMMLTNSKNTGETVRLEMPSQLLSWPIVSRNWKW